MNRPNKCKNCQWYNKPYWSIINPCDNCPNENDYKTIVQIDGEPVFKKVLTEEEIKKAMTDKSIFELTIEEKDKEIERLNKELKEKKDIINKFIADENGGVSYTLQIENERLNNIIKGIETYCNIAIGMNFNMNNSELQNQIVEDYTDMLDKLKELKEGK